jgi:hypothetical protein
VSLLNNTGSGNTATGRQALQANTGDNNTAAGYLALYLNIGSSNTASGYNSGRFQSGGTTSLTTASNSVFIGATTKGVQGAANQLVLGYAAESLGANTVVLGNDSIVTTALKGNVGIGTVIPTHDLEIETTKISSTRFKNVTPTSALVSRFHNSADDGLSLTVYGPTYAVGSIGNVGPGGAAVVNTGGALAIGTRDAGDVHLLSNDTIRMTMVSGGNVGIGTNSPAAALHVVSGTDNVNTLLLSDITADASIKDGFVTSQHYTNAQEPIAMIQGRAESGANRILIGGSHSAYNTATSIELYTAATSTTTNEVERMRITSAGNVGIGTTSPSVPLHVTLGAEVGIAAAGEIAMFQNGGTTTDNADITLLSGNIGRSRINLGDTGDRDAGYINFDHTTDNLHFGHVGTQDDLTIDSSGNVGIGTTTPGAELDVAGGIITTSGVATTGNRLRLTNPGGGSTGGSSTQVGAIKVTLPVTWTRTMLRMTIKVYDFATNESFTVVCGGYTYAPTTQWLNHFAYIESAASKDTNFTVRFGHDGTKCCIYIGELTSVWRHPHVYVTEVEAGYLGYDAANWQDGWAVGFEASAFGAVTKTQTDTQINNWSRSGQDVHFSSGTGNVGIGTTTPNASAALDVSSTTKAFLPPRMTTTQKNAIASPAAGMVVYDTTLSKLAVYTGSAWETITSA